MRIEEFEAEYRRHAAAVLGYARRCVGRSEIAEEIASDALIELLHSIERIDAQRLPAWLYTVVKNRAIDYWRRQKLEVEFAERPQDAPRPAEFSFDWGILESAGLNAAHRLCLTLRYVHGMSREEIAEYTGLRETQVKGYLRYGLGLLRKTLAEQRGGKQA
jgi:RNA polymerase sigma factor (sigma-70 family)